MRKLITHAKKTLSQLVMKINYSPFYMSYNLRCRLLHWSDFNKIWYLQSESILQVN